MRILEEYNCEYNFSFEKRARTDRFPHEACFAQLFGRLQYDNNNYCSVTIKLHKEPDCNNYCPFDIHTIKRHLNILKDIVKFKSSVKEFKNYYIIYADFKNNSKAEIKYSLTWIRYLFEFPYSFYLYKAYELKELAQFRFESIANLFVAVASLYSSWRTIHSICVYPPERFLTREETREHLKITDTLNSIYTFNEDIPSPELKLKYDTDMFKKRITKEAITFYNKIKNG